MSLSLLKCRVCSKSLGSASFNDNGPSLTSIRTVLNIATKVWVCENCGHAQSPDLPDISDFYDTQYRISLDIDGHDQLYENKNGQQLFRTAYQAEMLENLDIPKAFKSLRLWCGQSDNFTKIN